MILKWIFDRLFALIGLLFLWPVFLIVAIMVKLKMPGGPVFFVQKRVGKGGTALSFKVEVMMYCSLPDSLRIGYFFYY